MRGEVIIGVVVGSFLGYLITKLERELNPKGHSIIGSIVGASVGGLVMAIDPIEE